MQLKLSREETQNKTVNKASVMESVLRNRELGIVRKMTKKAPFLNGLV